MRFLDGVLLEAERAAGTAGTLSTNDYQHGRAAAVREVLAYLDEHSPPAVARVYTIPIVAKRVSGHLESGARYHELVLSIAPPTEYDAMRPLWTDRTSTSGGPLTVSVLPEEYARCEVGDEVTVRVELPGGGL